MDVSLGSLADPWHWHWVSHTILRYPYRVVAWTWGGAGQGGQASEAYGAFSSSVPCLALVALITNWWRRTRCHIHRCWRRGRFRHGEFLLCAAHHPRVPSDGRVTVEHVKGVER